MHRFHCPPAHASRPEFELPGDEAHHAAVVLRLQAGASATVLDGQGGILRGELTEVTRKRVRFRVADRASVPARATAITLFQCIPKGGTMEWIIEKAAELGATRLVPVLSERTVVKVNSSASSKLERWRQTAVTALKQCGGPWLMELTEPMPFARALAEDRSPLRLVGALRPPQHSIRACCESHCATTGHRPAAVSLWIGPEGDFTSAELDALLAQGAHPVVFCDQVLRAETAAIAALAVLVNEVRPPDAGGVHFGAWGTA